MFRILAVNPGSTSTKIAIYDDEELVFKENIVHSPELLAEYRNIGDQYEMRRDAVVKMLGVYSIPLKSLSAVAGRGGMLPPVKAGAYEVNPDMVTALRYHPRMQHASNLGGVIAYEIALPLYIPAYIYDPVTVDEMEPAAKVTGLAEMRREAFGHNLNVRATAMRYAKSIGKQLSELDLVVAHLGGGISIMCIKHGRIVDLVSDEDGPFTPERAGALPLLQLVRWTLKNGPDERALTRKLKTQAGFMSHFGTSDALDIEKRADGGDEHAAYIYGALAYCVAKYIGQLTVPIGKNPDAIILTGGLARSKRLTDAIKERVSFLGPVEIIAGENEMESLAMGALRVLRGEEAANTFVLPRDYE